LLITDMGFPAEGVAELEAAGIQVLLA